jgi:pimeloyl-ACP methyl ester carboxylesterase
VTERQLELAGIRVGYRLTGSGPPVVLPHARPFVRWYEPLIERLSGYRLLAYHRDLPDDPSWGVPDDARLCTELLAHLGIERPHVVGHSYGGLVALELARADPAGPRSLALLEPATTGLLPPAEATVQMPGWSCWPGRTTCCRPSAQPPSPRSSPGSGGPAPDQGQSATIAAITISLTSQSPEWIAASIAGTRSCKTEPDSSTIGKATHSTPASSRAGPIPTIPNQPIRPATTTTTTAVRSSSSRIVVGAIGPASA